MGSELTFLAAFIAGLAGSLHCLGMCGGIAASLGMAGSVGTNARRGWLNALLYNVGRITSYAVIGAAAAGLVMALGIAVGRPDWGGLLRLVTAFILIAIGVQLAFNWAGLRRIEALGGRVWQHLAPLARRFMPPKTPLHALALGGLWGWLPCGLVYTMVLAASVSGNPINGAAIMIAFGLGTLPAMTGTSLMGQQAQRLRQHPAFRQLAGALLIFFGLWTAFFPLSSLMPGHGDHSHSHVQEVGQHQGHHDSGI
ncbi:sulfite exporter TauE/SafE [Natronospira proteinivora]|uniref:Sulfite exporter TauE/SafE n=1 Tax=Natronospira proteinivora TaxID=1807133 RepID=A0ABT1G862_9GAMM|nr:sulfite exporter TauE/SafE family protein [Natronospira proteinivora]MCP1727502.1 sulfite exporter TauE/SafE [Natronospira proteinivora]